MHYPHRFYAAGQNYATFETHVPAPCFRKEFHIHKTGPASLTVCGLGFYELFVNGNRITRGRLSSYIANPDQVLYYDTYDVSTLLCKGENVVALMLGNGFLNCVGGSVWNFDTALYRGAPKFALHLSMEDFTLDASDFVTAPSPILFDDMRAGEWYDARIELGDWLHPGYDDSTWRPVIPAESPRGIQRENKTDPILVQDILQAVSFHRGRISIFPTPRENLPDLPMDEDEQKAEGWLYDFGVNTTGVCRLCLKNTSPGQKIILQYGEILGENPAGGVDTTIRGEHSGLDLRGFQFLPHRYNHRDVYICKGGEEEVWEPYFTHHGFRYCLVIGLNDTQAAADTVKAVVFHTALESRASFCCSDEMVNRLWEAGIRSDLGNFCHFPTDCPHREKNGWTGDAQVSAEQMLMAFSCENNLREWLCNLRLSMKENGELPGIVPTTGWGYGLGPAWDAALIEIPYQIWRQRGETAIIRENAAAILRYLHYLSVRRSKKGLIEFGLGDWCQSARTSVDDPLATTPFTSTVIAMDICRKAAAMFCAIGLDAEYEYALHLSKKFRSAGRKHLLDINTMTAYDRSQTAQAMALYYDLFEPVEKQNAFAVLLRLIHDNQDSFDCGILGMRVLFHVLSRFGYTNLALHMITKSEFPSYGYWIENGATTFWEIFSPIKQVQSSCNHHFFGDILSWFIQNLTGIQHNLDAENIHSVVIAPQFPEKLNFAEATVQLPDGTLISRWEREGDSIHLNTVIPEGMDAVLRLDNNWQTENGFAQCKLSGYSFIKLIPADHINSMRKIPR